MVKIQDYTVIGNSRSAALISNEGSIDWLCWPRFDSPSLFAHLLDDQKGGRWKIAPASSYKAKRSYCKNTNVLKTIFKTKTGTLVLTDFMPVGLDKDALAPENEIIRIAECAQGSIDVDVLFSPRPNYGLSELQLKNGKRLGLRIEGKELFTLLGLPIFEIDQNTAHSRLKLKAKERHFFSLTCHSYGPAILHSLEEKIVSKQLKETISWWEKWTKKISYNGPFKEEVIRSALLLKLLSFSPSGAIVAAPTTSLPERLGGKLNWDYRFCWLRDASFICRSLYGLKSNEEGRAFVHWLLYTTKLSRTRLNPLFDVYGRYCGKEKVLKSLKGFENSSPVRINNGACTQFQLDIHGEVIEAISHYIKNNGAITRSLKKDLKSFGKYICSHWTMPDNGIWEARGKKEVHTYSLLMCWVALKQLISMKKILKVSPRWEKKFIETQANISKVIEEDCWNEKIEAYTAIKNGDETAMSLLHLAIHGFIAPDSPRMKKTFKRIVKVLKAAPNFYYRNQYDIERREGTFNMCAFWVAEYLAIGGGTVKQAKAAFKRAANISNELGLIAEETNPKTKNALGNFPQGLSHVGLINAALAIYKRGKKK